MNIEEIRKLLDGIDGGACKPISAFSDDFLILEVPPRDSDIFPQISLSMPAKYAVFYSHAPEAIRTLLAEVSRLESLATNAKREADSLATSLYKQFYQQDSPEWGLCDTPAGVITQIDNMVAGICEELVKAKNLAAARLADQEAIERHTAKRVARECAEIARDIRTTPAEGCETSCLGPCGPCAATAIRQKYGVK